MSKKKSYKITISANHPQKNLYTRAVIVNPLKPHRSVSVVPLTDLMTSEAAEIFSASILTSEVRKTLFYSEKYDGSNKSIRTVFYATHKVTCLMINQTHYISGLFIRSQTERPRQR